MAKYYYHDLERWENEGGFVGDVEHRSVEARNRSTGACSRPKRQDGVFARDSEKNSGNLPSYFPEQK
jgi:hypothetical protein